MKNSGFTLVEILIVIAIAAILVSLALPNYQESVRKSRRSDAQTELMELAGLAERIFTQTNSYCSSIPSCPVKSPLEILVENADGLSAFYDFSVDSLSPTSFALHAAPKGSQASDKCKTMNLTHTGYRTVSDGALAGCW